MSILSCKELEDDARQEAIRRRDWADDDRRLSLELDEIMRQIRYDSITDTLLAIVCLIVVGMILWGLI